MIKEVIGVTAPAVLLAPVAVPILHGLSGLAVVGLGLFAAGTVVAKTVGALAPPPKRPKPSELPPVG